MKTAALFLAASAFCASAMAQDQPNPPAQPDDGTVYGGMKTRWAKDVSQELPLPEYPRPQLRRDAEWVNLNGQWDYAIAPKEAGMPEKWDGKILVPFPVESQLSGVRRFVGGASRLWYRRTFEAEEPDAGGRLRLHFGAVDWDAEIWLNGRLVATHQGGYDPFTVDITESVAPSHEQELVVAVYDPSDADSQPRGKQVANPHGIWYTPVTGIWQTVWLEPVPAVSIDSLKLTSDIDKGELLVEAHLLGAGEGLHVEAEASLAGKAAGKGGAKAEGSFDGVARFAIKIDDPQLWSPDSPTLYDLKVTVARDLVFDTVESYFGMRKIAMGKDEFGFNRMMLNNQPVFQFGPLDQGWWPDGLYTAPTDEALRFDIEKTKELGFNMARKHVKVEPARWYYWADKLGLLVWQDMPNGGRGGQHIAKGAPDDAPLTPGERLRYHRELQAMIDEYYNHPSIVVWVPFNEGWGQHDTNHVLKWAKAYDPSRLINGPSGWEDRGFGDMMDMHMYPGPGMFPVMEDRISVLGEYGGLGLAVADHLWWNKRNWGYRSFESKEELRENYDALTAKLAGLVGRGLAAAVYTQTTDVEGEVNGLMTYDREVVKFDPEHMRKIHAPLYAKPVPVDEKPVLPTSETQGHAWRYTTEKPADGWEQPGFDDAMWKSGPAGFGTADTPGTVIRTTWDTESIWIRRTFTLDGTGFSDLQVRIAHDEDADIYINGKPVLKLEKWSDGYFNLPAPKALRDALQKGENTVAIHVVQTTGGQAIDFGLIDLVPRK